MIELIKHTLNNIGLLLLLVAVYDTLAIEQNYFDTNKKKIYIGIAIGIISTLLYSFAWQYSPQLVISSRSILFNLGTLFFGPFVGVIGFIVQICYQASFNTIDPFDFVELLVSIFVGSMARSYFKNKLTQLNYKQLVCIGFINIMLILLLLYLLPIRLADQIFNNIDNRILVFPIIFPMATLLIGLQLIRFFQRNELKLKIAQQKYLFETLFDAQSVGLILYSPDNKDYEINHYYCALLGYNEYELKDISWGDLTHPNDLASEFVLYDQLMNDNIDRYAFEKRILKKNGMIRYIQINLMRFRGRNLKPRHLVCALDITELKRIEGLNKYKKEQLEIIVTIAGLGLWRWDIVTDQIERNVNSQLFLTDDLNVSDKRNDNELLLFKDLAIHWEQAIYPDDQFKYKQAVHDFIMGKKKRFFCEYRIKSNSGKQHWIQEYAQCSKFNQTGEMSEMIGLQLDITHYKVTEQRLILEAMLSDNMIK